MKEWDVVRHKQRRYVGTIRGFFGKMVYVAWDNGGGSWHYPEVLELVIMLA